ncbi:MAG: gluconate 2-dehydrogenase subunit 3 family protein [Cytophagaceae bacterium]|nr:gluconate 2-dehydrogenase subunit 3 family protein [Cytophagaceae bacterium]
MNRRIALQRVAIMMGGAISAPTLVAMLEGCKSPSSAGTNFSLIKDYQALVSEIAEVIIPKTDTPGAKDANVGPFIEKMLKDCYSDVQQNHFVKGLDQLEEESKKLGSGFVKLSVENKTKVMNTMVELAKKESETNEASKKAKEVDSESGLTKEQQKKKDEVEIPVPFFTLMKELTVFGFFTSEIGATKTLDFIPIPGRYEGCIPLKPGQKAYAI